MKYENIKTENKKETSEVEITGEISEAALSEYRKQALKEIGAQADIAGFRKGHIPEKIITEKFGDVYILEKTAELALKDIAPEIIEKNVPDYIGRPQIAITKLAPKNPVGFKIVIAVMPEVTLPDYKKIAKKEMSVPSEDFTATEKEIEAVVEEIRGQRAHHEFHVIHKDKPGHEHNDEEINKLKPEFTDEFVKSLGNFESVADFREKAKENILKEKEFKAKDRKRGALFGKLIAETTLNLPQIVIDNELQRMFAQFESDVRGIGIGMEDYLKHIKKTPEDLAKDWRPDAEKRARLNIILEEIAKKENITSDKETVEKEVEQLTKNYKDIDPIRARLYADHMLKIEKTIVFLEGQK
jgi:FKBP-type peptidyl-prolyl cis-trans isomerase (trigger factor)